MRLNLRTRLLAIAFALSLPGTSLCAQQIQSAEAVGTTGPARPTAPAALNRAKRARQLAKHTTPAKPEEKQSSVSLKNGQLSIDGNSASLAQILNKLVAAGSMTVEGKEPLEPVFGTYGPGTPREVLTQLLTGSGYNFMMIGLAVDGLPRQIILTGRSENIVVPPPVTAEKAASPQRAETAPASAHDAGVAQASPAEGADGDATGAQASSAQLGPGAIEHVPPNEQTDTQDTGTRVQQNIQRLQQMQAAQSQPSTAPQE